MTDQTEAIESVLRQFKIDAIIGDVTHGPSVSRYELMLGDGVRVESLAKLQKNFSYATAATSVRVLAPIPGKSAVGIELPRDNRETVYLKDLPVEGHPLTIPIGKGVEGEIITGNLAQMPHLLVAGCTGSGKSSFINAMLLSLLEADPEKVRLILCDPKACELTPYEGIAHLLRPVATEVDETVEALDWLVEEMQSRYQQMRAAKVRHADDLGLPYIVMIIDELADLMLTSRERIEIPLTRLLQKARAAGIHLVVATQRPSVDVVTGILKANLASRLAFATSSLVDSRVILDEAGAEQLLGKGDGLYKPIGARTAIRVQGAYVSDREIRAAVRKATATADVEEMVNKLNCEPEQGPTVLDVINEMIAKAERARDDNAKYLEELLKPKKWWGGSGGKLDQLSQAPEKLGRLGM